MNLVVVTIVLDGMPYIVRNLPIFDGLDVNWQWIIVEGASDNQRDTKWCKKQEFRLSNDGTTEYLSSIKDPRITIIQKPYWHSKTDMVNEALSHAKYDGILMQIDSDEMWTAENIDKICEVFDSDESVRMMKFFCRYYLGPDIISVGDNSYGNNPGEWLRAWRFRRGMQFNSHEPPVLNLNQGRCLSRDQTKAMGLVFDHYSYALEKQLNFKEKFYGYTGAVEQWKRLQANTQWPCRLKDFLPWVDDHARATRI